MKSQLSTLSSCLLLGAQWLSAQDTAFTYQGQLIDGGSPASGTYALRLTLYDAMINGSVVAGPITNAPVVVTNGLFTTRLNFGPAPVSGAARWLEIAVRANGAPEFITLSPRQELTPAPYALYALAAGKVSSGSVAASELKTINAPLAGQILTYNGTSLLWDNPEPGGAWTLSGNAGTTSGSQFLGTTDNQALEFKVSGTRALRIEPTANTPNLIAGHRDNLAFNGVVGAVIGGGGGQSPTTGTSFTNQVDDAFGTIGGGLGNRAGNQNSDVVDARYATVGGGILNTASAYAATIGGGHGNLALRDGAAIGGGQSNKVFAQYATISGGRDNAISNSLATIAGGIENFVAGTFSTIGGGWGNTNVGSEATIGGGGHNTALGRWAAVGGGSQNHIGEGLYSTIAGGFRNTINSGAPNSAIGGGRGNVIASQVSTIGGGEDNFAAGQGGNAIGGGRYNTNHALSSVIAGGYGNVIQAGASDSVVGGGLYNTIATNAVAATVPGGVGNFAAGDYSFAAGYGAYAYDNGSFVWCDSTRGFSSTSSNQFLIRASGGVGIGTSTPGAQLDVAGSVRLGIGSTVFSRIQAGSAFVGAGEGGVKTVTVTFPTPFSSAPKVLLTPRGEDFEDTFAATARAVTATGFKINVLRLDAPAGSWGQITLSVDWLAWE